MANVGEILRHIETILVLCFGKACDILRKGAIITAISQMQTSGGDRLNRVPGSRGGGQYSLHLQTSQPCGWGSLVEIRADLVLLFRIILWLTEVLSTQFLMLALAATPCT